MRCGACPDLSNLQLICLAFGWRALRSKYISSARRRANKTLIFATLAARVYQIDLIYGLVRAGEVPGDVRGNIGIKLVCEIEKHLRLPSIAHDLHDAFVVVAPGLAFDDSLSQDFIRRGCDIDFNEAAGKPKIY